MAKIRVLIVDDSKSIRTMIDKILSSDPDFEVVGHAADGIEAVEMIKSLKPDLVTLDIIMPRLTGVGVIDRVMAENPVRILMVSSVTEENAYVTLKALEKGALDFITKPASEDLEQVRMELLSKARALAGVPLEQVLAKAPAPLKSQDDNVNLKIGYFEVICIGLSTGGPSTLVTALRTLPKNYPIPILVVQHMPKFFTAEFAAVLDSKCALKVKEAEDNETIKPGYVYIAPGDIHMTVKNDKIELADRPPVNGQRPSVDMLFISVAEQYKAKSCGIILTGMGNDGLQGVDAIKARGGRVIAQNKETSVVFGMPKSVIEAGLADRVMALDDIPAFLMSMVERG